MPQAIFILVLRVNDTNKMMKTHQEAHVDPSPIFR